jgi:hypothetical protein
LEHEFVLASDAVVLANEEEQGVHLILVELRRQRFAVRAAICRSDHDVGTIRHLLPHVRLELWIGAERWTPAESR